MIYIFMFRFCSDQIWRVLLYALIVIALCNGKESITEKRLLVYDQY